MGEGAADGRLRGLSPQEVRWIDRALPFLRFAEDGRLRVYGTPAEKLWDGGHPSIVFLPERAVANFRNVREAFTRRLAESGSEVSVSVHFALKSCYVPAVVRALRAAGAGVEVMSRFEWRLARGLGFTPGEVVANAVRRDEAAREEILTSRAGLVGVDGGEELAAVCATARRLGVRPDVAIRVRPLPDGTFFTANSKLGTPVAEAVELLEAALRSPDIGTVGVHGHQLRKSVDPAEFGRFVGVLGDLAADVSSSRRGIGVVNLGGGLESRYVMERAGARCEDFAEAAWHGLRRWVRRAGDGAGSGGGGPRVMLEPGRHVVSDAAVGFTRLLGTKAAGDVPWAITEIGSNVLSPFSDRAYHPLPLRWDEGASWRTYHVSDGIAVPEVFCLNAPLPNEAVASGMALLDCGAYTTGYSELWGCDLPDLVICEEGAARRVFGPAERARMFDSLYGGDAFDAVALEGHTAGVLASREG